MSSKKHRVSLAASLAGALGLVVAACAGSPAEPAPQPAPSAPEQRAPEPVAPRPWEHERSDLPVDPRVQFGALPNGLRYAWARNAEPDARCYLRLHVDVGSLAEEESERGMAHFLEHMAFNGSENFEPGTLVEWFQAHGMAFGADTNAQTGFSSTIYQLDLPDCDEETLREGLTVLRDFADRLTIAADEVEAEKGVIDGEQRERDSAGYRVLERTLDLLFAGTRVAERLPIGTKEARDGFSAASVRAFYERWYRPDLMTLVAVGDFGELDPSPLFAQAFGDAAPPAVPRPVEPPVGAPENLALAFAIAEPEIPVVSLTIARLVPWEEERDTRAERLEDIDLDTARSMLNLRFYELAKLEGAPFVSAAAGSAEAFEVVDGEELSISAPPESWRAALAVGEQELRRAIEHGFAEAELAEIRADVLRGLDEAVERERTAHSLALVGSLLAAAEDPHVPTDAEAQRALYRPAILALTVEDCHAALREAWSRGASTTVYASGSLPAGVDGDALRAELEASRAVPVEPRAEAAASVFAYASDPAATGAIASREHVDDLDFERVRFANGVALDVKKTDFKQKQILVGVHLGEGRLTLDPEQAELEWVAGQVFNGGGLVAHSEDDLRRLTAGKEVGVGFAIAPDEFSLGGSTTREDLLLQCELACAYLEAPGWRPEGMIQFQRNLPLVFESLKHQHQGPVVTEFIPELFSHDPRFGLPGQEVAAAVTIDAIRAWLAPELAEGALEVTLVGDLDVEETIAIAARTFGMLPPRREWRALDERRVAPTPKSGVRQEHEIDTEVPKSMVLIAYPVPDAIDPLVRRRFQVLQTVVNDRLRVEVREKLGASYSPGAGLQQSETYPGVGMLLVQAMADPGEVETLVEACLAVGDALADSGVTQEEADRLREPILARRRDAKRTNGYWMGVLAEAQRRPESLDEVRGDDAFFESYTADEITPLAREFLKRERASVLVVDPKTAE